MSETAFLSAATLAYGAELDRRAMIDEAVRRVGVTWPPRYMAYHDQHDRIFVIEPVMGAVRAEFHRIAQERAA